MAPRAGHATPFIAAPPPPPPRPHRPQIDGRGMQFEALHVEECVRAGLHESPVMPLAESVAVMRVLDAVRAQIGLEWPKDAEAAPPIPPL